MIEFLYKYAPVSWAFAGLLVLLASAGVYWLYATLKLMGVIHRSSTRKQP
jgi:hypothetical protein